MSADRYHLDPAQFESKGRRPSVVYSYLDADGAPVGAVARFEPVTPEGKKAFLQYRYERGRYVLGLAGGRLPPYRLPELAAAIKAGKTVWWSEGEKCVDALVAAGLVATCNAGGAGQWHDDDALHLRGAHTIGLADSDDIGRKHVQQVAASLHGVATSVRALELPASAEGDDVVDWFERGGSAELLSALAGTAAQWLPPRATVEDSWPDPVPFAAQSEPEPFPIATGLTEGLAEFAQRVADVVHVDVAAPAVLLPAALSGAVGNAYEIQVSPLHTEPNLSRYASAVLESGDRKSGLFRHVIAPFANWVLNAQPLYEERKRSYDAEVELWERRKSEIIRRAARSGEQLPQLEEPPRPPRQPRSTIGDTTMPALVRWMHANGGAALLESADARHVIDAVLGQHRSDGQVDDSVLLRAHGGDTIDRSRIGSGGEGECFIIHRPALAVMLAVQPDKIEQLAGRRETLSSGLLARFNFVWPRSHVGTRFETGSEEPIPPLLRYGYWEVIEELLKQRFKVIDRDDGEQFKPVTLTLDAEARELRRLFTNELEGLIGPGRPLNEAQSFVGKCSGEAARLAGLLHLDALVRAEKIGRAIEIPVPASIWCIAETHQRWQLHETLRVLEISREDLLERRARKLVEWVRLRIPPGRLVTSRDAIGERRVANVAEFDEAMEFLSERGWARRVEAKGREQTARWAFHPKTHGGRS